MKAHELVKIIRSEEAAIGKHLNEDQKRELEHFLLALLKKGDAEVATIAQKLESMRVPVASGSASGTKESSRKATAAAEKIRALAQEVIHWKGPEYEEVDRRIAEACQGLTKSDLSSVSEICLRARNASKSKAVILELLAQPIKWQLQLRFMDTKA